MSTSAGIIPYRINNGHIEFFVGHPGGPYWKNNPYYAFLKGGLEEGEDSFMAAIREFKEESGLSLPSVPFISLGAVKQNSKKLFMLMGYYLILTLKNVFQMNVKWNIHLIRVLR